MSDALAKLATLSGQTPSSAVRAWVHTEGGNFSTRSGRQRPPVEDSPDLQRIISLERRTPVDLDGSPRALALVELMTSRLSRRRAPGTCACASMGRQCITRLNPVQAWTLWEAPLTEGIFGSIGVGDGKCLAAGSTYYDVLEGRRRDVVETVTSKVMTVDGRQMTVGSARSFPSGYKRCVRLSLRDGAELILSTDHPVLTQRGWVQASELQVGLDYVAVPTSAPEPERCTAATDDEVSLMALLMADGNTTKVTARFTNMTPAVIKEFQRCADTVCGGWHEHKSSSKAREFSLLDSTGFREQWNLHGLSKEKRTDPALWGLPRRQIALFLNRFWACDGHVADRLLDIALASEDLIEDLRFMLLRLSVRSRKSSRVMHTKGGDFICYRLMINGADALRFLNEVGDVLGKEEACRKLRLRLESTERNTNVDVVPLNYYALETIYDELGVRRGEGRFEIRTTLKAQTKTRITRENFVTFCHKYNYTGKFAHLRMEGVAWEEVQSIEYVGVLDVYDLHVPATHNFVANNIVVHNTGLDILISMVLLKMNETAVLFVPPRLRAQLHREYLLWREHFRVPTFVMEGYGSYWVEGSPLLRVVPYSKFSREESTDLLKRLKPKLVIGDEAHYLRHRDTARTGRALNYFAEDEIGAMSAWWTGSPASSSIKDFAHLLALSLGPNSPLPIRPMTVEEWSLAVDPIDNPAPFGALKMLRSTDLDESVVKALHRRLVETRGFISTTQSSIKAQINILERKPPEIPMIVRKMLDDLRTGWIRPDGEELVDPLTVARSARELACGFFYRWRFPRLRHGPMCRDNYCVVDCPGRALVLEWLEKRRAWHKELREKLKSHVPFLDSPLLVTKAAIRAYHNKDDDEDEWVERYLEREGFDEEEDVDDESGRRPKWKAETWPAWRDICDKIEYESEAVWVDDYLARDAARWAQEHRGIVWYSHSAFGQKVAEISGLPFYNGGDPKKDTLYLERGDRSVICSINAYGTGTDGLQRIFYEALVTNSPSSADRWDQLIGRLHRPYQPAPAVNHWAYRHTEEMADAVDKAVRFAKFIEGIIGTHQKLLVANCEFI